MRLERLSPNPQPLFLVVKPGSNILYRFFLEIPFPVSVTSIIILGEWALISIIIDPLPSIASSAFFNRFSITQSNKGGDIIAYTGLRGVFMINFTFSGDLFLMYSTMLLT